MTDNVVVLPVIRIERQNELVCAEDAAMEVRHQIQRAKIREPREDQHIGPCHWSKTGWAIVNSDGCCTCQPAKGPVTPANETKP